MKQARVISDAEKKRLLAVIQYGRHAERNRLAIMLSHYAGLRVGEIAALRLGDVIDMQGQVFEQTTVIAAVTKSNEARDVFISTKLQREIRCYTESFPKMRALDGPLLLTQKNSAFSANSLCQLFSELYHRACIKGASSHSGRRGFISKLSHSLVSPKVIMELAGHKHLSTTQRYIDVTPDMKRSAVEIV